MTLDLNSQLFQDAVAIAGRPSFVEFGRYTLVDRESVSEYVVECSFEHHFRVWLEENAEGAGVRRQSGGGYFAWLTSVGWLCFVHGDTYIECQMKAVVEIDKAKVKT